jgi:AraC-like DNA-binding protein
LRRAESSIEQHASEEIRVRERVRFSRVSERTLEYEFTEQFGIGPKQFLNAYRLCMARRHLLSSDLQKTSLPGSAANAGFESVFSHHERDAGSGSAKGFRLSRIAVTPTSCRCARQCVGDAKGLGPAHGWRGGRGRPILSLKRV